MIVAPSCQDDGSWRLIETQTGKKALQSFATKQEALTWARNHGLEVHETSGGAIDQENQGSF